MHDPAVLEETAHDRCINRIVARVEAMAGAYARIAANTDDLSSLATVHALRDALALIEELRAEVNDLWKLHEEECAKDQARRAAADKLPGPEQYAASSMQEELAMLRDVYAKAAIFVESDSRARGTELDTPQHRMWRCVNLAAGIRGYQEKYGTKT